MASTIAKFFIGPRIYAHKKSSDVNGWVLGTVESLFGRVTTRSFLGLYICCVSGFPRHVIPATQLYFGIFFVLFTLRGILRYQNTYYTEFIGLLDKFNTKTIIKSYNELIEIEDFINLQCYDYASSHIPCQNISVKRKHALTDSRLSFPEKVFSYLLNRVVSKNVTFPGSCSLSAIMLSSIIKSGRSQLVGKEYFRMVLNLGKGLRIDTMFVDRRNSRINSEYLVITCEGNLSFYETGVFRQVLSGVNHSVLGWNYPGFSESKGLPYSENVQTSIIAVIKYAENFLKFPTDKIIIVGWSIGGYSAICGACEFPKIKGIVVDASFTNTLAFARDFFPLLRNQIEKYYPVYFNLNNDERIKEYNGRILMIARTKDAIMQLSPVVNGEKDWSRSYNLSFKLALSTLTHRYPYIFTEETVSLINSSVNTWPIEINMQRMAEARKLSGEEGGNDATFPSEFGKTSMSEDLRFEVAKQLFDSMLYWHPGEHQGVVSYAKFIDLITDVH